jgi:hypothetical protein
VAWVEGETWELEQGLDGRLEFRLFEDDAGENPWAFTGWDVNATLSDQKGRTVYPVEVDADAASGIVRLILPESTVNSLRVGRPYRYDCLMVAPGDGVADDHSLASGPATVALRTSRRDA